MLDATKLDAMREAMGEHFVELIPAYFESMASVLDELAQAAFKGDLAGIERGAHSIKSASLNVGGDALAGLALALERHAREGAVDAAPGRIAELRVAFEQLRPRLEDYQQTLSMRV
jgi:two-component system sensor histidine kinase BarA